MAERSCLSWILNLPMETKRFFSNICEITHNVTLEKFSEYLLRFFDAIRALRGELTEIHEHTFHRNVLEHFDMNLSVSIEEAEWIIWNGISRGVPTPGAAEMLKLLSNIGIRTGIISNLCWSGAALTKRLHGVVSRRGLLHAMQNTALWYVQEHTKTILFRHFFFRWGYESRICHLFKATPHNCKAVKNMV